MALNDVVTIPRLFRTACIVMCILGFVISCHSISKQLMNYRKPFEQRLMIRIQLMVPIFSISCGVALYYPSFAQVLLDPIKEVYEAFIIYTFFSLMTLLLGGEREIITVRAPKHRPLRQPIFLLGKCLRSLDLADPADFLFIKIGILQYVWFKPFYSIGLIIYHFKKWPTLNIIQIALYNLSMTWSLYNLALFWACLSTDLKPFDPWRKFLCVKLIIFASYWQSLLIEFISKTPMVRVEDKELWTYYYQNAILCLEMVGFAIFHLQAFPWDIYSILEIPYGARLKFYYAIRDCFGYKDLKWDFEQTFFGSHYYNYRIFDPTNDNSDENMTNSNQIIRQSKMGIRFSQGRSQKYWVSNYGSTNEGRSPSASIGIEAIDEGWDLTISEGKYHKSDLNYPVAWTPDGHRNSRSMNLLRQTLESV